MKYKVFLISLAVMVALSMGIDGCPDEQEAVLDHFKCYGVQLSSTSSIHEEIVLNLEDQFGAIEARVGDPAYFCNPVAKTYGGAVTSISNQDHHLTLYGMTCNTTHTWHVEVDNQFGQQELTVSGPVMVAVPTQKGEHSEPEGLDHFLLYWVEEETLMQITVDLEDQWHLEENVQVIRPAFFAIPAKKTHDGVVTEIQNPDEHLVFYKIVGEHFQTDVDIVNQFGPQTFSTYQETQLLAVPSEKTSFQPGEPPEPGPPGPLALDHFKCYWLGGVDLRNENVHLEDQFGDFDVTLNWAYYFCNPVEKTFGNAETDIKNSDHHLTIYDFDDLAQPQTWSVEVDNQFGRQDLTVTGPIALAVPTQKLSPGNHGSPVGLDHFLLYQVTEGPNANVVVDLNDQFGYEPNIPVTRPRFFANPVQKTHDGDTIFPIQNPDEHLVFYDISGAYQTTSVSVINQFGQPTFDTYEPALLAVPSEKISATPEPTPEPGPLDHFTCYWTGEDMVIGQNVYLEDQFGIWQVVVEESWYLCNPVVKTHGQMETQVWNYDHHLMIYSITPQPDYWYVQVSNQFGTYQVTLQGPVALAVPTQKLEPGSHGPPLGLDHFLLYEVVPPAPTVNQIVDLGDQFGFEPDVLVTDLVFFANPVRKTDAAGVVTEIQNPDDHLLFCAVEDDTHSYGPVSIDNQFGDWTFPQVQGPWLVAVPSEKISFEQPEPAALDHFMCYWVGEDMVLPEWPGVVYLEDQFCAVEAEVEPPWGFYNPAEKWHDGVPTPISNPDHHLLAYDIYYEEEPQWWQVEINNQFGLQQLIVYGPVALALPTQKIEPMYHGPPVGLDHFMLYEVIEGPPLNVVVSLNDQFGDQPQVEVGYPDYFFNPAQKTDASGMVTPIENPLAHLVSYEIYGQVLYQQVQAANQFGEHSFPQLEGPYCVTVPSEKITWQQLPPQQ